MELAAADACRHLTGAGIGVIVLKGPAIARWLYDPDPRYWCDVDLLVPAADFHRSHKALAELGYTNRFDGLAPWEVGPYEHELLGQNGVCIDLHHRLIGVPDPPERCWDVLSQRTVPFRLATGAEVRVLDIPARTMHLALHAAQDGPIKAKAIEDLSRGLAQLSDQDWRAALQVADELGAIPAFAAGLRIIPSGRQLADELLLPECTDVELALRSRSAPRESIFFDRLVRTAGVKGRAALVVRKLWPTRAFLTANSSDALRGGWGLLRARLRRSGSLLRRGGPALAAWWRAWSDVGHPRQ